MNTKKLWLSAFACLIFTALWLVLMILSVAQTGPINSFEEAIHSVMNKGVLFNLSYINAVFVTITATMFYTSLYYHCKLMNTEAALFGFIFVPVYSILNLVVYLSQVTIVPQLISHMGTTHEYTDVYLVILGQFVQGWSGSAISFFNQLAYAVLGIPSIIFGMLLMKHRKVSIWGGRLLALNGLFCIIGLIGVAANIQILSVGSLAGGVFFLLALVAIVYKLKLNSAKS